MSLAFTSISEAPIAVSATSKAANAFIDGAVTTSYAGVLGFIAKALTTIPSSTSTASANALEDLDAQAKTNAVSSVSAVLFNTFSGIANTTTLTGISSNANIKEVTCVAKASTVAYPVFATFDLGISYSAKANTTLDAAVADADLVASDFEDVDAQADVLVLGVSTSMAAGQPTPSALQVVFSNLDYSKDNVVNIVRRKSNTVYINREPKQPL